MKRILAMLIMMCGVTTAFAADYNNISIQGQLTSPAPIYGVKVHILSGGAVVGTASDIALIPDTTDFIFSTQTYITNPWVFQTGSDYTMRLSSANGTVISTFSITAVPFALTVRGDAQTGNQNVFGAYGNVGIGTGAPLYRLEISSAAGSSDDIVVISTGSSAVIKMTGAGVIHANKYYGDGSSLTGVTGTGDNLGNHTATQNLNMAGYGINTAGDITAARYKIAGSTVLVVFTDAGGWTSLGVGVDAGRVNSAGTNVFIGNKSGYSNTTATDNTFVGDRTGYLTTASGNTFVGEAAGYFTTSGGSNSFLGALAGGSNITGRSNTFLGNYSGGSNTTGSFNSFIGLDSGYTNTTGWGNVFSGYAAGLGNTSGSYNIAIGYAAAMNSGYMKMNIADVLYSDMLDATIGIGKEVPEAALDVVSTGTANYQFAQIWRDSTGAIKSSMSATGVMMASKFIGDGSGLTGIVATGGVLKTGDTMTGPLTLSGSSLTVTGNQTIADNLGIGIAAISGNSDRLYISGKTLSNTVLTLDATPASGGYGAQIKFKSKTAGGVDNQWDLGTGVSGSANALELYDGSALRMSIPIAGGVNLPAGAFSVGGSTLVVTGGNVGIGTSNPTQKLTLNTGQISVGVDGTAGDTSLYLRGGAAGDKARITLNHYGTADYNIAVGDIAGKLSLTKTQGGSDGIVIDGNGNVGIGTTSPAQKLEVAGNVLVSSATLIVSGTSGGLRLNGINQQVWISGTDTTSPAHMTITNSNGTKVAYFGMDNSSGNNFVAGGLADAYVFATGSNHPLLFGTNGASKAVILGNGNVGIGTTGPSSKLDVVGDVTVSSSMTVKGNDFGLGDYTSYNRQFEIKGGVAKAARIRFSQGSGSTDNWVIGAGGASETSAFEIYNGVGALPLQIDKVTSHTTIGNGLTVSSVTVTGNAQVNGNVGIGTASPSAKLQVSSGTIHIDGTGAPAIGGALCLNSTGNMSKCTSAIDSSGNCTCP